MAAASDSSPLLPIAQTLLPPDFLFLLLGSDLAGIVDLGPFVEAFIVLIVIPPSWPRQHRHGPPAVPGA